MNDNSPNRLIDAYNHMMGTIRSAFESTASEDMSLTKAMDMAREEIVRISDITVDEAEEISNFIKRDINDAAEYMMESSAEFSDWLMLDIEVVERRLIELFLSVADKTRIELEQFNHPQREITTYYSGEITGPGTLVCSECGQQLPFVTTAQIGTCPSCGNNTFNRIDFRK